MKILNEEHFENVKRYAESIGDTSLKMSGTVEELGRKPDYPCEISLYYDHAPYSFGFTQHSRRKNRYRGRSALSWNT